MIVKCFVQTPFQQNTRVVFCERTRVGICIDPGEASAELAAYIANEKITLQAIALTHGHLDHVGGTSSVHGSFPDAEMILHSDDEPLYYGLPRQPLMLGLQPGQLSALGFDYENPPKLTRNWTDSETYPVGDLQFEIRHCPGHTPGHVVLVERTQKAVFVGDCLFQGSIGRTDLPGGSYEQLMDSIENRILSLGDDYTVYSGHGPETTIGLERASNPFLTGAYDFGGRYI